MLYPLYEKRLKQEKQIHSMLTANVSDSVRSSVRRGVRSVSVVSGVGGSVSVCEVYLVPWSKQPAALRGMDD